MTETPLSSHSRAGVDETTIAAGVIHHRVRRDAKQPTAETLVSEVCASDVFEGALEGHPAARHRVADDDGDDGEDGDGGDALQGREGLHDRGGDVVHFQSAFQEWCQRVKTTDFLLRCGTPVDPNRVFILDAIPVAL